MNAKRYCFKCGGDGKKEVLDEVRFSDGLQKTHYEDCPACEGDGWVYISDPLDEMIMALCIVEKFSEITDDMRLDFINWLASGKPEKKEGGKNDTR